jgi:cellulose binding protein with CBM3 domain
MQQRLDSPRRRPLRRVVWSALLLLGCSPAVESIGPAEVGGNGGGGTSGKGGPGLAPAPLPGGAAGGSAGGGLPGTGGDVGTVGSSNGAAGAAPPDAGPAPADAGAARSSDAGRTASGRLTPTGLRILYRCAKGGGTTTSVGLMMTLKNDEPIPVDLKVFKLRYWITTDNAPMFAVRCEQVQAGQALDCASATVKLVPLDPPRSEADAYIEVGFSKGGIGYTASVPVTLRLNATAPGFVIGNDYSCYSPPGARGENDRVTAYVDGQLIWGKEP